MNYIERVKEQDAKLAAMYAEAQKNLAKYRLNAALYDAAQAVLDAEKPGETVAEILINTESTTSLTELYAKAEEKLAEAEKLKEQAKDVLSKAEAVLASGKPKKTVYRVMYAYVVDGQVINSWPTRDLSDNTFSTLAEAATALKDLKRGNSDAFKWYVASEQVDA